MRQLTDDRGHLSYVIEGDGPPVVLVHPGVTDYRMWDAIVPALAEHYTVVRYDLRGFGQSPPPSGPFDEIDDLRGLLDHLGYDRVHLVGASWGARVAVEFTGAHPGRVRSLALFSAPWPGSPRSAELSAYDEAEAAALAAGDLDTAVRVNLDMWLRGPSRSWDDVAPGLADAMRGPLRTSLANQDTVERHSRDTPPADVSAITVPTLVGVGMLDVPQFVAFGSRYAAEIPHATLISFPNAAHLIAWDTPVVMAAALESFLADTAG